MPSVDLNNKTLAKQAARRIVEDSAFGKALQVSTPGKAKDYSDHRLRQLEESIAHHIEETYAPWCSEEFRG